MNNFNPRAQQVLALARQEANRLNHNYVGTEHLLLGLIKLGKGVAVTVLQKLGLDLEQLCLEVEKQIGPGSEPGRVEAVNARSSLFYFEAAVERRRQKANEGLVLGKAGKIRGCCPDHDGSGNDPRDSPGRGH